MNKEYLKKAQPIVYQTLSNALKNKKVANAYLFHGPKGSSKLETAILFAQSIVCEHTDFDGFACQECESCKRIENEESLDYMIVSNDRIKKKDIVDLQAFFESTSAGKQNARIYILDHYDKATPDASNSLLKFLEEPSEGIYGILIAHEKSNVLPQRILIKYYLLFNLDVRLFVLSRKAVNTCFLKIQVKKTQRCWLNLDIRMIRLLNCCLCLILKS